MAYIGQSLTEGTRRAYTFVATSGQTTFNAVYGVGAVDVYQNGILLQPSDYNSSSGSSVVLGVGAAVNDEITIIAHNTFSVADTVSSSQGGTFTGAVTASNGLTVDDDGATPLTVDRATNDGTIIDVQKDGTSVGKLGIQSTGFYMDGETGHAGIRFAGNEVSPRNAGSDADNTVSLGESDKRFKDLYLGGGAYLGGTGAANKLSDVESGTWTPTVNSGINVSSFHVQSGSYRKIGNYVVVDFYLRFNGGTGNGNSISLTSLPFSSGSGTYLRGGGVTSFQNMSTVTGNISFYGADNSTNIILYINGSTGFVKSGSVDGLYIIGQYSYFTD